jgi:hypothetical protein
VPSPYIPKDSRNLLLDFKRKELSRVLQSKINNEQVFNANLNQIHNVREHPNKRILLPRSEEIYKHQEMKNEPRES